ncbi:MAG: Rap1a/Tai family immunity protein [Gallionella sp.]
MNIQVKTIASILMVISIPVAQAMDGKDLLAGYNSYKRGKAGIATGKDAYDGGQFDGYVSGVFDSAVGIALCVPADVKSGQIQEVVGQFLETHPESRQRSAVLLSMQALMKAFPCK